MHWLRRQVSDPPIGLSYYVSQEWVTNSSESRSLSRNMPKQKSLSATQSKVRFWGELYSWIYFYPHRLQQLPGYWQEERIVRVLLWTPQVALSPVADGLYLWPSVSCQQLDSKNFLSAVVMISNFLHKPTSSVDHLSCAFTCAYSAHIALTLSGSLQSMSYRHG